MTQQDPNILAEVHNTLACFEVNDDVLILSIPLACFGANRSAFEAYIDPEERSQFLQQRLTEKGVDLPWRPASPKHLRGIKDTLPPRGQGDTRLMPLEN